MVDAPKIMKQPSITCAERRTSMRPPSISNPIDAIARTAMLVAIVPVNVPSSQLKATTTGFDEIPSLLFKATNSSLITLDLCSGPLRNGELSSL